MRQYISGQYVDVDDSELLVIEEARRNVEKQDFYADINSELTLEKKLMLFLDTIPTIPQPRSNRVGFLWKPMYDSEQNVFGWEEIPDPYYKKNEDGTYLDPITYVDGMYVVLGKWYTDGEDIWECIKEGISTTFNDREYFDVIGV